MKTSQLTFTRFIAAMSIVVLHFGKNVFPFNIEPLYTIFGNAGVGVSYFFVLSGFVMVIAYGNRNKIGVRQYYLNRIARIYPLYLLALILMCIITIKRGINPFDFVLQVFALQAWFPPNALKLNWPAWSLSVEALFYLAFPALLIIYKKIKFKYVIIGAVILWLSTQIIVNYLYLSPFYKGFRSNSHDFIYYFPLFHINEFIIGNIAGFFYLRADKQRNYDVSIILLFTILIVFLSLKTIINYHDGLVAIIFAPLILLLALNNGKITQIFNNRYLIILGEASYGIYILQACIINYCLSTFKRLHFNNEAGHFYCYLVILLITSITCYLLIEVPARNWIKNYKGNPLKNILLKPNN